jgi:sialic acid synthase SpsE
MNLKALVTLKEAFGLPVGISDHSPGYIVPIASVALGASFIEKHVTFDRSQHGPDHPFAMTMEEFGEMVRQIRFLEEAMGTGDKKPTESEQAKQHRMRRGVYNPVTLEPTDDPTGVWLRPEHQWTRSCQS